MRFPHLLRLVVHFLHLNLLLHQHYYPLRCHCHRRVPWLGNWLFEGKILTRHEMHEK